MVLQGLLSSVYIIPNRQKWGDVSQDKEDEKNILKNKEEEPCPLKIYIEMQREGKEL